MAVKRVPGEDAIRTGQQMESVSDGDLLIRREHSTSMRVIEVGIYFGRVCGDA